MHNRILLLLVLLGLIVNASAQYQVVTLDNGTIKLGVCDPGYLRSLVATNWPSPQPDTSALNFGGTEGVNSEGWGLAADDEFTGNPVCEAWGGGPWGWWPGNLIVTSFSATPDQKEATSIVEVTNGSENPLEVKHTFTPLPSLPNVYKVDVTIKNLSSFGLKIRYRRTVVWFPDLSSPDPWTGVETLQRGVSSKLILTDNSYYNPPNPNWLWSTSLLNMDFTDVSVYNSASLFDLDLGVVLPQDSTSFSLYYGGFADVASLRSAINTIAAEAYCSYGVTLESPQFLQAWTGIGGSASGIRALTPTEGVNGLQSAPVLLQVSGRGFDANAKLMLRQGENEIIGTASQSGSASVTAAGFQVSDSFNLRGVPA